jgi:hypothetical protein
MTGTIDENKNLDTDGIVCIFCGITINQNQAWSHVDGDANLGVKKIEYFCSEEHKSEYFKS